jgi:hypothetical protein
VTGNYATAIFVRASGLLAIALSIAAYSWFVTWVEPISQRVYYDPAT